MQRARRRRVGTTRRAPRLAAGSRAVLEHRAAAGPRAALEKVGGGGSTERFEGRRLDFSLPPSLSRSLARSCR
eukprot:scaffold300492_cov31-Tisochrysis_lutea.AAC.1